MGTLRPKTGHKIAQNPKFIEPLWDTAGFGVSFLVSGAQRCCWAAIGPHSPSPTDVGNVTRGRPGVTHPVG